MNTLDQEPVREVLARLHEGARAERPALHVVGREMATRVRRDEGRMMYDLPTDELVELFGELRIPVAPATGRLLYLLARSTRAERVVEFGTSFGVSTIYLAAAVRDNGGGQVVGTELHPQKVEIARRNLMEAGLDDLVDVRAGDALQTLAGLSEPIDLLLLDGFPAMHLDVLRLLEPLLRPGALVVADGVPGGDEVLRRYHEHVRDAGHGYLSLEVPLGDTLEVSLRTRW